MVSLLQPVFYVLLRWAVTLLALPVSLLLLTPVILIGAAFTRQKYWEAVKNGYRNVTEFWLRLF
jgi:hypothetical protein